MYLFAKFKTVQKLSIYILAILFSFACNTQKSKNVEPGEQTQSGNRPDDKKLVEKIFYNVPSPLEMAKMARDAGMIFNPELMNPIEKKQKYIDQTSQALNLGVYGADLSYSRIFDQVQRSVNYLSVIRELTESLQIPQNQGTFAIDRLEQHIDNRDSLLNIITEIYGDVDIYLKENNRSLIAVMIISGGWIEGNYLALQSMDIKNPDPKIQRRVAEQKLSLKSLIKLVEPHVRPEHQSSEILHKLQDLNKIYQEVKVSTSNTRIDTDQDSGKTTINGKTTVQIKKSTLEAINNAITQLRNKITTP